MCVGVRTCVRTCVRNEESPKTRQSGADIAAGCMQWQCYATVGNGADSSNGV